MEYYLRSALIVVGLLFLQSLFVNPFLELRGIVPDLLLIWLIYVAVTRGHIEASIAGFAVGLLQDATTTQFFGLAALTKTIAGFIGGYFFNENKILQTLGTYRFMVIVILCSFAHNILYFLFFLQGSESMSFNTLIQASIATTLYTGALSALPMFAFSRKLLTAS